MSKVYTFLAAMLVMGRMAFAADYTVTNVNDAGPGSLRQAILDANAHGGSDNILFAIPGGGPHTIMPFTPLPVITGTTNINGYTQPGSIMPGATWPAKIMVMLQGSYSGNGLEFAIGAAESQVKGLSIVGFGNNITQAAIYCNASDMVIAGNLIGLKPDGTVMGNTVGIYCIGADNIVIGGTSPESRNVVSGNTYEGITFVPVPPENSNFSTGHTIQYNYVGTNVYGTAAIGNELHGIDLDGANNSFIYDNVVGGSGEYGIGIDATYAANPPMIHHVAVMRNRIGIGVNGEDIGNRVAGIMVINAHDITIGSSVENANIIAYNGTGVVVHNWPLGSTAVNSYNVHITYNRIFNNDGLGIDLNGDGVTLNDQGAYPYDQDMGPNGLQNYPVIDSAYVKNGELIIKDTLKTDLPNSLYIVEFFNNPQGVVVADAYGYECYTRIGQIAVTTDGTGKSAFTAIFPFTSENGKGQANYGDHIVSLAHNASKNSSEISPAFQVTAYTEKECYSTEDNIIEFTIPTVPLATGYNWEVPPVAQIVSGQGTTSVQVNWANVPVGTYTVCVSASNDCGTSFATCMPVEIFHCKTDLVISKTDVPDPVIAGETLTYTITVTNAGPIDALNVVVSDPLPSGLTVTGSSATKGTWTAPGWSIGTIAAGSSEILTLTMTVDPGYQGFTLTNTATVVSDTPETNTGNNSATAITTINHQANISVTKERSFPLAPVIAGDTVRYTIWVTNNGPGVAYNVSVTDVHAAFEDMQYSYSGTTWFPWPGVFPVGTMHVGDVTGGYIRAKVKSDYTGTLTNTVTVDWNTYGSTVTKTISANDAVPVNTSANLVLHKEVSSLVTAGAEVGFTLSVTNLGPSDAVGVTISDVMASPPYEGGTVSYTLDNGITWEEWTGNVTVPGTLAKGASLTLELRGILVSDFTGTLTNTGTVTSSTFDPVPGNNTYSVYPVAGTSADISILKTGPASVVAGETITYTIVVSNAGPSIAKNVVIEDIFSSGIYSGVQYSYGTATGTWTGSLEIGTLSVTETATITISAFLKPDLEEGSTITNTAVINSSTPCPYHEYHSSTATSTVTSLTDVSIVKTMVTLPENIVAGGTIRYNLAVTNNGPSNAYTVVAMDIPAPGITLTQYLVNGGSNWFNWPSSGNQITVGTMVPGQTVNIQVEGVLAANSCGTLTNTATVSTTTDETNYENNISAPVAVTVLDRTLPQITCPVNISVSCNQSLDPVVTGSPSISDNCDNNPGITYTDTTTPGACANNYTITRTWKATDISGNFATCDQTITVFDNTPPSVSCPPGITVKCARDVPAEATNLSQFLAIGGTVSDNCTASSTITVTFVTGSVTNQTCHNRYTLTRTYRATDQCGNSSTCQQVITVFDDVAATFDAPDDLTISCEDDITDLSLTGTVSGTIVGNCGGTNQEATYLDTWDEKGEQCNGTGKIYRIWTVTDQCGNASTRTQTITIVDNTPPMISCRENQSRDTDTGVCTYTVTGTELDPISVSDNCGYQGVFFSLSGATTLTGTTTLGGAVLNPGTTTVTWSVTDECGNTQTCTFEVEVTDSEVPVIQSCPETREITGCGTGAITGPEFSTLPALSSYSEFSNATNNGIAADNCGIVSVTYQDVTTDPYPYLVTRTWSVSDASGNTVTCTQLISVNDEVPVAQDDVYQMVENTTALPTSLTGNVLGNDYDIESQYLIVSTWGTPSAGGTLSANANGVFTYTPPIGFHDDIVTFTYTICDECGRCDTATVRIYVLTCVNNPASPGNVIRNIE